MDVKWPFWILFVGRTDGARKLKRPPPGPHGARSVRVRAVVSFGQSFLGLVRVRKSWAAERACADWEVPFILGGKTAISADLRC